MYKIYIICIDLFFIIVLAACNSTIHSSKNQNFCSINKCDDLKFFDCFNKNLCSLKMPKNLSFAIPISSYNDYDIPFFDSKLIDEKRLYKKPSIYPPIILKNINN